VAEEHAMSIWSHWGWPLATALVGILFTVLLIAQYMRRRQLHQLAWTAGFFLYALGALMEAWSEYTAAWDPTLYRIYIVIAAALVGFLGLGVLYLVVKRRIWGHIFLAYVLAVMAVFIYGAFARSLDLSQLVAGITVGGKALGPAMSFPRICSLFLNIPGTLFLVAGAVYSIVLFSRRKEYSYRAWANVLIVLGTLVIAAAGARARAGQTVGLYPAEMIGAALLLWGFLKAGTLQKGAQARKAVPAKD
jgi:hypothetical protein